MNGNCAFLIAAALSSDSLSAQTVDAGIGSGILASALMTAAGGLIFYGDGGGAFVAADELRG